MKKILFIPIFISLILFSSCSNDDNYAKDDRAARQELIKNDIVADVILTDIDANLSEAYKTSPGTKAAFHCGWVDYKINSGGHQLIVDYGAGCKDDNGNERKGKIIVVSSAKYLTGGITLSVSFDNYLYNGCRVTGSYTKHIENFHSLLVRKATITENIQIIHPNNKGVISRKGTFTRQYDFGSLTTYSDDCILWYGNIEVKDMEGHIVQKVISGDKPLRYLISRCEIVSGVVSSRYDDDSVWSVDFGDGTADGGVVTITDKEGITTTNYHR